MYRNEHISSWFDSNTDAHCAPLDDVEEILCGCFDPQNKKGMYVNRTYFEPTRPMSSSETTDKLSKLRNLMTACIKSKCTYVHIFLDENGRTKNIICF